MPRSERPDMAAYGVPDDLDGVLPWTWAESRLIANRNYWLVTASAQGRPHAMPVWGVWLPAAEQFGFSCAASARKVRNLADNPKVVVTIDDTIECVSLEGHAAPADTAGAQMVARTWAEKYEPDPAKRPEMEAFALASLTYLVTPERAFGLIERDEEFGPRATRWVW